MLAPIERSPRLRRAERFRFPQPLPALLGDTRVVLNDLSELGAGIAHNRQLRRSTSGVLSFDWEGKTIVMQCSVVRTALQRERHGGIALTVYHSGLSFEEPATEESQAQKALLAEQLARALDHQRSNAYGVPLEMVRHLPDVVYAAEEDVVTTPALNLNELLDRSMRPSGLYVRCSLEAGRWVQSTTDTPDQPEDGFTISGDEQSKEIETLCWTYQQADAEGRKLIRTFAHLSIADPADTPRGLYGM